MSYCFLYHRSPRSRYLYRSLPCRKKLSSALSFSHISSLRVKKEYKTIYKKITQEPGGLPTSAATRTPRGRGCLFGIFVLTGRLYPTRSRYVHGGKRKCFAQGLGAFFSVLDWSGVRRNPRVCVCFFLRCLRKTKSIPYEIRRAHLIEDYPDTL